MISMALRASSFGTTSCSSSGQLRRARRIASSRVSDRGDCGSERRKNCYGEGGILTEAVRRRPYSVILLDEMEKAHPGVQDVFFQVFDKGTMKDGEGRDIDFKNCVIIMTSNAGTT